MAKFYKIRHKPTGLFFKAGVCNLSLTGKVYPRKPSLRYLCGAHGDHGQPIFCRVSQTVKKHLDKIGWHTETHKKAVTGDTGMHITLPLTEFEIVEYNTPQQ